MTLIRDNVRDFPGPIPIPHWIEARSREGALLRFLILPLLVVDLLRISSECQGSSFKTVGVLFDDLVCAWEGITGIDGQLLPCNSTNKRRVAAWDFELGVQIIEKALALAHDGEAVSTTGVLQ